MRKEDVSYNLAMIYTLTLFDHAVQKMEPSELLDHTKLTKTLYCLFEESYISFLQMENCCFDFSDIQAFDAE